MASVPSPVEALLGDLKTIFGPRLESLVMYGAHATDPSRAADAPIECLAIVQTLTFDDLRAAAAMRGRWNKQQLATPLFLTHDEFARSLDVFPFEYGEIIDRHVAVLGDPFSGLDVTPDDRRRACEVQAKSHLLHLREGFIECGGRAEDVAQLITRSAAPLAALLRHIERLSGATPVTEAKASAHESHAIRRVLALATSGTLPATDAIALYPDYLRSIEALAHAMDRWGR